MPFLIMVSVLASKGQWQGRSTPVQRCILSEKYLLGNSQLMSECNMRKHCATVLEDAREISIEEFLAAIWWSEKQDVPDYGCAVGHRRMNGCYDRERNE